MADLGELTAKDERNLCRAFAALSAKPRLDVVRLLVGSGAIGSTAGAIADELGVSPSNASFHLKELEHAGLIISRRSGRSMIYAIEMDRLWDLIGFLCGLQECGRACPNGDGADDRTEDSGDNHAGQ